MSAAQSIGTTTRALFVCAICDSRVRMREVDGNPPTCGRCNRAMFVFDDCPTCGELVDIPPRGWHECPRCHRQGCGECMPAGVATLCPECEDDG